jgi:TolB protein
LKLFAYLFLVALALAAIAALGRYGGALSTGEPLPPPPGVNLIAYVGADDEIRTIRPDGSSDVRISPEGGIFTWPTWSPDGRRIAFSGTARDSSGAPTLGLYIHQFLGKQTRLIYTNEPGTGPILDGLPHYHLWAPDGSHLAFMASSYAGLTLFLDSLKPQGVSEPVVRRAPLYAAWSADSSALLVHGGLDHFVVEMSGGATIKSLGIQSASYRTPDWSPFGNRMAFVSEEGTGKARLYIADVASGNRTLVEEVAQYAAFLWSPNGKLLAVAHSELPGGFVYGSVSLFSEDGSRHPLEIQGDVIAFFWSPNSAKLAYVTLTEQGSLLRLMVADVADGSRWPLVEFLPTLDQLSMLQFFDQFAHSHSLWSPDSQSLVFSGELGGEAASASLGRQEVPHVFVVGAERGSVVEPIAEGYLAFWSPR